MEMAADVNKLSTYKLHIHEKADAKHLFGATHPLFVFKDLI